MDIHIFTSESGNSTQKCHIYIYIYTSEIMKGLKNALQLFYFTCHDLIRAMACDYNIQLYDS